MFVDIDKVWSPSDRHKMYESSCSYQSALDLKRASPIAQVCWFRFRFVFLWVQQLMLKKRKIVRNHFKSFWSNSYYSFKRWKIILIKIKQLPKLCDVCNFNDKISMFLNLIVLIKTGVSVFLSALQDLRVILIINNYQDIITLWFIINKWKENRFQNLLIMWFHLNYGNQWSLFDGSG